MPLDDMNWLTQTEVDETTALLIRARGFIERGWCRGTEALTATGSMVQPTSDRAVAWCMYGATSTTSRKRSSPSWRHSTVQSVPVAPAPIEAPRLRRRTHSVQSPVGRATAADQGDR